MGFKAMSVQTLIPDRGVASTSVAGPAEPACRKVRGAAPVAAFNPARIAAELNRTPDGADPAAAVGRRLQTPVAALARWARCKRLVGEACTGLEGVSAEAVLERTRPMLEEGGSDEQPARASVHAARALIETEPNYAKVAARLFADQLRCEALRFVNDRFEQASEAEMAERYAGYFQAYVARGVAAGRLAAELGRFDLARLGAALKPERDRQFDDLGLQRLAERCLIRVGGERVELPLALFMRVAMGLALR